jgi:lipopolysaccharide/colanic/teichoic acid biosynthesis glycosyltransferase
MPNQSINAHPAVRSPIKRLIDLLLVVLIGLVTLPLLVAAAIIVGLRLGTPILFQQVRAGLQGREFSVAKLRTMTDGRDPEGHLLPDSARLTPLGKTLRSLSIDELPQLMSVLRGDMSLVGPRPLPTIYLPRYSAEENRRHDVKPGITGLAQINGRNAISWDEKFRLDLEYVDQWSLGLDLRILARTVLTVLQRSGVSADGEATMTEFMGSSHASGFPALNQERTPHVRSETELP